KRFVDKFSMAPEQLKELSEYCRGRGVAFSSTPYSEEEVDFLARECDVPYIKIASMEINNPRFLRYIGGKGLPVVLSTGMSDTDEIERAVAILEESGVTQLVLLHCVSIYPTVLTTVNLNNIIGLRERFPRYPVGFSDHTEGDAAAVAATALGAALIEKHLTLDHTKVGMDNGMATEPEALRTLVSKCRDVQLALGSKERVILPEERKQRQNMRRSIVARRNIPKGTVLTEADLYAKRPGTGIAPDRMEDVLGKTALRDLEADTLILPEDLG
ncbi:MAG: N-acetylneuraminate synthase family protein, partial [Oscillospiraceae bacterium]|nr:N-acetylneuraminate synthase family protein [Oscillospiraceae bacterium]